MKLDSLETSTSVTTNSEHFLPQKCVLFLRKIATNKKRDDGLFKRMVSKTYSDKLCQRNTRFNFSILVGSLQLINQIKWLFLSMEQLRSLYNKWPT